MSQSRKRKRIMNFMQQQMIFIIVLTVTNVIDTVTLSDKQLLITLHNYVRTWNEALAVCQQENGTLYIEDSYERSIVLEKYKSIYAISQHMWIGLHYPLIGNNNVFGWAGICMWQDSGYIHYKAAEPKHTATSKCILSDKTTGDWITDICGSNQLFVCQSLRGSCTFDSSSTGIPTPSTSLTEIIRTTIDASACKTGCMTMTNNNENCWGLNFDQSLETNNCFLYFTTDPFYFDKPGVLASSILTLYKKRCYTVAKDTVDNTPVTSDSSSTPTECSAYSSQLLTPTSVPSSSVTGSSATETTTTPTTSVLSSTATTTTTTTSVLSSSATTTTTTTTSVPSSTATTTNIETSEVPTSTSSTLAAITSSTTAATSASTATTITSSTTPASNITTSTAAPTSNASICLCNCSGLDKYVSSLTLDPLWNNLTVEEKVNYLVVRLRVEKTKLSSTVRKKTSAQDDRTATKSVGYVAIVILVVMLGLLVLSDAINFWKYVKRKWKNKVATTKKIEQERLK